MADLAELRQFTGPAKEFWPRLLGCAARLSQATHLVLLVKSGMPPQWKKISEWSAQRGASRFLVAFTMQLEDAAVRAIQEQSFLQKLEQNGAGDHFLVGLRLKLARAEDEVVLAIPIAPRHTACAGGAKEAAGATAMPFASLRGLMGSARSLCI